MSTGKVREAAAVGLPDEVLGQSILVYVVPHDGEKLEGTELIDLYAAKVPRYMVPRRIEFTSDLPKTAHGKIDYPTLRTRATRDTQAPSE